MSAFAYLAMEGADEPLAPLANGEESQVVAAEIVEEQNLAIDAGVAIETADAVDEEHDAVADLEKDAAVATGNEPDDDGETATESAIDPTAAKLLKIAMGNIVGKQYAGKVLPATESFEGTRSEGREATRIALEGMKETLKQFWEAIKAAFRKTYTKIKDWVVKTFSAAKKLKQRAESLQKKANDTVGTIEDKSFSFGQTKAIAVEGKYSEPAKLLSGLNGVTALVKGFEVNLKSSKIEDAAEEFSKEFEASFKSAGKGSKRELKTANFNKNIGAGLAAPMSGLAAPKSGVVGDVKKFTEMYGDINEVTITMSDPLPGGRAIILVQPKNGSPADMEEAVKTLKNFKLVLGNDRYNPREVSEGDVKTLTTSQIDKVCDDVIEIAESIFEYEKNWSQQQKFVEKIERDTDAIVKEFDQEQDADSRDQRIFRNYANGMVGFVRRHISNFANFSSYGLNTGNAFLNYAERSLAQHKSK